MSLTITTWNVNSVRLRKGGLARLAKESDSDVICLQEIKVTNELFPEEDIKAIGYPHLAIHGQPGYHGVAVLSKKPIERAEPIYWCGKDDCR
ncbi:MAG: endonuclease/exonuclease/phosphatase family protein, partial [Geminicoccaceae bacterium]